MKKILIPAIAIILAGCVYMGKNFDETKLASISKGRLQSSRLLVSLANQLRPLMILTETKYCCGRIVKVMLSVALIQKY